MELVLEGEIEELLVTTFKKISPSDIVKSKILQASFRDFLERGTPKDYWELVPQTHKAVILNSPQSKAFTPLNTLASNQLVPEATECISSPVSPLPPATIEEDPRPLATQTVPGKFVVSSTRTIPQPTADAYLSTPNVSVAEELIAQTQCTDTTRIQRLIQAIEAMKSATALPLESYGKLWSAREGLFNGTESGPKGWMCRLQRGREKINSGIREFDCAARLSLLFVSHNVDYTEKWGGLPAKSGKSGYGRRSAAFDKISQDCGISVEALKNDVKRGGNYIYLIQKSGLGGLLELGSGVAALWEKNFSHQDVDAIIIYRKRKLPLLEERANSLNGLAARTLKAGLVACGWTSEALLKPTRLTVEIKKHSLESNPVNNDTGIPGSNWLSKKRDRNDVESRFDGFGQSHTNEISAAVILDDAPTSNAMMPVEKTGMDAWSTDNVRHPFHLPCMSPRPERSSEARQPTIHSNSAKRLQVLSTSGSSQGVVASMDRNMLDSLGRACYLPHTLELDSSLERTINPDLLSIDTNMLSSLDNARFLSDALDLGMLSTLDNACFLSDALDPGMLSTLDNACFLSDALDPGMLSTLDNPCFLPDAVQLDLNTGRSQPQFHHAEDENLVWNHGDTNTDPRITV